MEAEIDYEFEILSEGHDHMLDQKVKSMRKRAKNIRKCLGKGRRHAKLHRKIEKLKRKRITQEVFEKEYYNTVMRLYFESWENIQRNWI